MDVAVKEEAMLDWASQGGSAPTVCATAAICGGVAGGPVLESDCGATIYGAKADGLVIEAAFHRLIADSELWEESPSSVSKLGPFPSLC